RDRLLDERVLARLDALAQVQRPERRRGAEQDDVAARDHTLIGVEAEEDVVGRHLHASAVLRRAQRLQRVLRHVGEEVADRDQLDLRVGGERVRGGASAAAAAAEQPDLDHARALRVHGDVRQRRGERREGAADQRGAGNLEEVAAGGIGGRTHARFSGSAGRGSGRAAPLPHFEGGREETAGAAGEGGAIIRPKPGDVQACGTPFSSVTMRVSTPACFATKASARSGGKRLTTLVSASAVVPSGATTVASTRRVRPIPVAGSTTWE